MYNSARLDKTIVERLWSVTNTLISSHTTDSGPNKSLYSYCQTDEEQTVIMYVVHIQGTLVQLGPRQPTTLSHSIGGLVDLLLPCTSCRHREMYYRGICSQLHTARYPLIPHKVSKHNSALIVGFLYVHIIRPYSTYVYILRTHIIYIHISHIIHTHLFIYTHIIHT